MDRLMPFPVPDNEPQRLQALRDFGVLDSLPQKMFDDITALAAGICDTPMALISLVDADRQWFKSRHGTTLSETPRDESFCAHTIMDTDGVLVVSDARADPRFCALSAGHQRRGALLRGRAHRHARQPRAGRHVRARPAAA